jgi:hypothetical protein
MIYLPVEKWSSRYNSEFYTIRMNTWHYIRTEEELSSLLRLNSSLDEKEDDDVAATTANHGGVTPENAEPELGNDGYFSNDDIDDHNISNHNMISKNSTSKATKANATCSFLGISSTRKPYFCCHPGNVVTNSRNNKTSHEEQQQKKIESVPAVYYEIQVFIGNGGHTTTSGRKNEVIVYRRYSQFRMLCLEMDADEKNRSTVVVGGARRRNGTISDLMKNMLHPKHQPEVFDWFQSQIELCKLAWSETVSTASPQTSVGNNDYYQKRMMGLHSFLHTLLCQQECANNPSIEKFLGLEVA